MTDMPALLSTVDTHSVLAVIVVPGCARRDLIAPEGVRVWLVEMAPGTRWPHVDVHDEGGEVVMVIEGELIEGEQRLAAGSYLVFGPHSRHHPRTEKGVWLFGFNLLRPKIDR